MEDRRETSQGCKLTLYWEDVGRLDMKFYGNNSATLQFEPSSMVVDQYAARHTLSEKQKRTDEDTSILTLGEKTPPKVYKCPTIPMENNNDEFRSLSREARKNLQGGNLVAYANSMYSMAEILNSEGKYIDELKILMLVFYLDLNGAGGRPFLREELPERAQNAVKKGRLGKRQIVDLYLNVIDESCSPKHTTTVLGSFRLFYFCLLGKKDLVSFLMLPLGEMAEK